MSEELIKTVQNLIKSGKGDSKILHDILNILKQGAPLYLSDYKYLEGLTSSNEIQKDLEKDKSKIKSKNETSTKEKVKMPKHSVPKVDSALSILKKRLAEGEITIEEFKALKKVLKES